ncbi:hypothetical protein [Hansschlegelia plantiphila]|nr:hypothetical protein [Hansschlegelia plantiphila]
MEMAALVSPAVDTPQPKLDVDFLKVDYTHVCTGVKKVSGGIEISALCQPAYRKIIAAVHAVSETGSVPLFFQNAPKVEGSDLVGYTALVPRALLNRKLSFQIVNQNGDTFPAFVAGRRKMKLPVNWQFAPYYLTLSYDPAAQGKSAPESPVGAFVRSISVLQDKLQIDVSLFVSEGANPPTRGQFVINRDGIEVFETDFELQPAKKVFRLAAGLHKQFSSVEPFHAELSVPIMIAFAERGLHNLEIRIGDDVSPIRPYNRYYYQKPSVLMTESDMGPHIVRHFADPISGDIRIYLE